jgi:hypothetical protein
VGVPLATLGMVFVFVFVTGSGSIYAARGCGFSGGCCCCCCVGADTTFELTLERVTKGPPLLVAAEPAVGPDADPEPVAEPADPPCRFWSSSSCRALSEKEGSVVDVVEDAADDKAVAAAATAAAVSWGGSIGTRRCREEGSFSSRRA